MTNQELLQAPEQVLGEVDRQRLYLLRVEGTPALCPACRRPLNAFEAAGIDLDSYDFGVTKYDYRCPDCGAELEQVVPFLAGGGPLWYWQFQFSWLQDRLRKARAFDQRSRPGPDSPA